MRAILERLKAVPWMMWAVWLGSVALLGLVIARHPAEEVRQLAEAMRPAHLLLPLSVVVHRNMAAVAGGTLVVSLILAAIAVARPQRTGALIPLAVGLALLYFAFHMLLYSQMMTEWMRATVREQATVTH